MKTALKIIASALLAPFCMLLLLTAIAIFEIATKSGGEIIPFYLHIALCIAAIPILIKLEGKFVSEELRLACNGAYFIAAAIFGFLILPHIGEFYLEKYYELLNPYDDDSFLSGIQWAFYYIAQLCQAGLHLLVRVIIAFVRWCDKKDKEQEN